MSKNDDGKIDTNKNDTGKKNSKVLTIVGIIFAIFIVIIDIGKLDYFSGKKGPDLVKVANITDAETGKMKEFANIDLNGFNAKTVTGQAVTADSFKEYDITMVNIWATYCGGCVTEMPDIAKLYKEKPEKSNIISICEDSDKEAELAAEIMQDAGAEFLTLIPDEKLTNVLLSHVSSLPTTIFVGKDGKMIGEPIYGGRTSQEYKELISDRINLVKQ